MSAALITMLRTFARLSRSVQSHLALTAFLAASAAIFSYNLISAEGTSSTVIELWASSVAVLMPLLASLIGMDVWSEERRTGMIDLLLSTCVRERSLVIGKFLGVFCILFFALLLSCAVTILSLAYYAPQSLSEARLFLLVSSFAALLMQCAFWSAAVTAVSAFFTHASASFCTCAILFAALPRALWLSLMVFSPSGRSAYGDFPLDAHVQDFASGVFSVGIVLSLLVLTVFALFLSSKKIASLRYRGKKSAPLRAITALELFLAAFCAVSTVLLAVRIDSAVEMPISSRQGLSPRMRQIIADSSGTVTVTAFLSRRDPRFRSTARQLRTLKRLADPLGGMSFELRYVDPKWDVGPASRLIRKGAREGSVVLEKERRFVSIDLAERPGERDMVSALRRLVMPPKRKDVCWIAGHGELRPDAYGSWGMSDIARELAREGYRNVTIDLAATPVPADCAMMVVAGAKDDYSRVELGRINEYLKGGGRLLVMMGRPGQGGVSSLLPSWGVRPVAKPLSGAKTLSGTDVVVSLFADHPVSSALSGSRIVLETPLAFDKAAVVESGVGATRIEFTPLARVGEDAVAVAVERGSDAGSDLAVRPTRIVVVGDGAFVSNGALAVRSCANRDFLINVVAYLSGTDAIGASGVEPHMLITAFDRRSRFEFTVVLSLIIPLLVFVCFSVATFLRRRGK
jgi:ABC-type transport system involved in multi-copper enzyme maturation permease subunit